MAKYPTKMMKTVVGALAIVGVLGASDAFAQQRPQTYAQAEAQLRAYINQLNVLTARRAAELRAQQQRMQGSAVNPASILGGSSASVPGNTWVGGNPAAILGGSGPSYTSRPATPADIANGIGVIGGPSGPLVGNDPNTAATLNRYAPGLVDQILRSQRNVTSMVLAPTCVRGQYCP